jgi:hypothetical protein
VRLAPLHRFLSRHAEAAIAAAAFAIVAALATAPGWQGLERRVFDFLTVKTARGELSQPISLIAINEEAMAALKQRLPWPRTRYAEMIDRVASGASGKRRRNWSGSNGTVASPDIAPASWSTGNGSTRFHIRNAAFSS